MRVADDLVVGTASPRDRRAAVAAAIAIVAVAIAVLFFEQRPLAIVPAFIPLAAAWLALPQLLTGLVFLNQYGVTYARRLAYLGAGYLLQAIVSFAYCVEFPGIFGPRGLFSTSAQGSSYLYNVENLCLAGAVIAYAVVRSRHVRTPGDAGFGRFVASVAVVGGIALWFLCARFAHLLPPLLAGNAFTPFFVVVVSPLVLLTSVAALVTLVAVRRLRTITDLWLSVVMLAKLCQIILTGAADVGRYTVGWYFGRVEAIVAAVLILAIFLLRLNGMTRDLSARNRDLSRRTADDAIALEQSETRYQRLAESLPQLVFTLGADARLEYANQRLLTYTGMSNDEAAAGGIEDLIDDTDRERVRATIGSAVAAGLGFESEFRLRRASDRSYRWFLCRASVAHDANGRAIRWFGTLTEIETQKRAEEREGYLARVTEELGASLDLATTLAAIARVAVPTLGVFAYVEYFGDDGRPAVAAESHDDPIARAILTARLARDANGFPHHVLERLGLGEHAIVLDPNDPLREFAIVVYPLLARDEVAGVTAVLVDAAFGERPDEARLGLAFARRAAIALERARVFERERRIADTLQRAMLPTALPRVAGVTFSAAYSAASESERVGGDFYDAFIVPDGRIAIVIGDVAGHGLDAAVAMGEVRQAIRASAFESSRPSQVLDRASRLFTASGRDGMVTAVFSLFDVATRTLTYAIAGHPAPLLRTATSVERLLGEGLPLGLRDGSSFEASLVVPEGASLAFFTDGLIEFARDVVGGEDLVAAVFGALEPEPAAEVAAALRDGVLAGSAPSDDIAVLVMTLADDPACEAVPARTWRFDAMDRRAAAIARRAFVRFASASLPQPCVDDAELVYGELLANVVQHAPGTVAIAVRRESDGGCVIVFEDEGPGFEYVPRAAHDDAEHGRGWAIIARLANHLSVERLPGGTRAAVSLACPPAFALNGAHAPRNEPRLDGT